MLDDGDGKVVDLATRRLFGGSAAMQAMEAYLMCLSPGQEARLTREQFEWLVVLAKRGMAL